MPKVKIKSAPKTASSSSYLEPLTSDMGLFHGPSHENGGIPYKGIEVEGGEPLYKAQDGSEIVFGNMHVPGTGQKFKAVAQLLAKKEQRVNKLVDKGTELVNMFSPNNPWDELKFNAGKAMMLGGSRKKAELKQNKEHLTTLQQTLLDMAGEMGADPQALSKGKLVKAKNGATLKAEDGWKFNGTDKSKLDQKILEFANLVSKKGYKGYSGPNSGYDKRNTKSGHKSRHASNQALDMIFEDPEVYKKILKDPELTGYLINNGLTVINEYDPENQKKTGADIGHLHVGYDQGTPLSDGFRKEAASLYQNSNPSWSWAARVKGNSKPIPGAKAGDAQVDKYTPPGLDKTFTPSAEKKPDPRTVKGDGRPMEVKPLKDYFLPSNAEGLDFKQILPELVAYGQNQVEPVWMQQYDPQLYQNTQVSFQDRLNENQGTFNSLERIIQNNPTALASLAAQKYSADNQVLGEEFRTNQQLEQDTVNKNISLLNDATYKNLQLADTQAVRQSQARSNTKALNNTILNSITSKIAQTEARNQALKYYESMTGYRFNPETQRMEYMGAPGIDYVNMDGSGGTNASNATRTETRDGQGVLKSTKTVIPSAQDVQIKNNKIYNDRMLETNSLEQYFNKRKTPHTLGENGATIQQMFKKR